MQSLDLLKRISKGISEQFGSSCEVVIHDLSADNEHTIVSIENGHVSNRKVGDSPSPVVLDAINSKGRHLQDKYNYLTRTMDGKILRSSTIFINGDDGKPVGVFSVNFDITNLIMAENTINSFLNYKPQSDANTIGIPKNVNELLDELILESEKLIGKPVALMSKEDKMKAVNFLNDSGAFLITKSGDKVANYFGISKYTLYNYFNSKSEV